jgi:gluconolactonase
MIKRRAFLGTAATATAGLTLSPTVWTREESCCKEIVKYPDEAIEIVNPRFKKYRQVNAAIERLYTGTRWSEGPVWFGDGRYLVWSDIPNNRMLRWLEETGEVSVFRHPSHYSNGNTRDKEGRLITCEHDSRRVTRTEHDGKITVLIDHFEGKRLNAPNDVAVHSDGAIWFTDPGYGIMSNYEGHLAPLELHADVYRLDPKTREAKVVVSDMEKPNGICFSPDEKKLYVVDTAGNADPHLPRTIRVYDVVDGNSASNGRLFVDMSPASSDGIRCDTDGNVWSSAAAWGGDTSMNGVHVFAPDGGLIGRIHLPEICANLCFGGEKRDRLFMAASQSLYSVYVAAQGALTP